MTVAARVLCFVVVAVMVFGAVSSALFAAPPKPYMSFSFSSNGTLKMYDSTLTMPFEFYQDYVEKTALQVVELEGYTHHLSDLKRNIEVEYNMTDFSCDWYCNEGNCCDRKQPKQMAIKKATSSQLNSESFSGCCTAENKLFEIWPLYDFATYAGSCGTDLSLWTSTVSGYNVSYCISDSTAIPSWIELAPFITINFESFIPNVPPRKQFEIPPYCVCQ